tara:strand:+ start:1879 stop:2415 length:537 start_codon:yes stop_codon:yes gene_type:complete
MTINLTIGCMFSGKTSWLLNIAKMNKIIGKKVFIVNFEGDKRYSTNKIVTHSGDELECFFCEKDINFVKCIEGYLESDIICINEGQFFENLLDFCLTASKEGKDVYVSGLDGDYLQNPFGEILNLIPHCETVNKIHAFCMVCKDGTKASFTKRIDGSKELILIGGSEKYLPVCRKCLT